MTTFAFFAAALAFGFTAFVAQIGLSLAVINDSLYGVVLFMAVATTLIALPFLKLLFAGEDAACGIVAQCDFCQIG